MGFTYPSAYFLKYDNLDNIIKVSPAWETYIETNMIVYLMICRKCTIEEELNKVSPQVTLLTILKL